MPIVLVTKGIVHSSDTPVLGFWPPAYKPATPTPIPDPPSLLVDLYATYVQLVPLYCSVVLLRAVVYPPEVTARV